MLSAETPGLMALQGRRSGGGDDGGINIVKQEFLLVCNFYLSNNDKYLDRHQRSIDYLQYCAILH